jgi:hypothetical protein
MVGRIPENYNLYPWRSDINWQPPYRAGRTRQNPMLEPVSDEGRHELVCEHTRLMLAQRNFTITNAGYIRLIELSRILFP